MSQLLDVQARAAWAGDWGVNPTNDYTASQTRASAENDSKLMRNLTIAGVAIAAVALLLQIKQGK